MWIPVYTSLSFQTEELFFQIATESKATEFPHQLVPTLICLNLTEGPQSNEIQGKYF